MIKTAEIFAQRVSTYRHAKICRPTGYCALGGVFMGVRLGWWEPRVRAMRNALSGGDFMEYGRLKRRVKRITPYGVFYDRASLGVRKSSGVYFFEIPADHNVHINNWPNARQVMALQPWCLAAYVSLSGAGLTVFYVPDRTVSLVSTFENVRQLVRELGYLVDPSGCARGRKCSVSYDPGCYVADQVEVVSGDGDLPL